MWILECGRKALFFAEVLFRKLALNFKNDFEVLYFWIEKASGTLTIFPGASGVFREASFVETWTSP